MRRVDQRDDKWHMGITSIVFRVGENNEFCSSEGTL